MIYDCERLQLTTTPKTLEEALGKIDELPVLFEKMQEEITVLRLSPVAWQHINLIGKYEFYNKKKCINLQGLIETLTSNKKINLFVTA